MIKLLAHLSLLVIENDEVTISNVETREVIDGGFGVVDILVDHEGGATCVLVGADTDLAYGTVFAEDIVHLFAGLYSPPAATAYSPSGDLSPPYKDSYAIAIAIATALVNESTQTETESLRILSSLSLFYTIN
ncbi:hypothetical protein Lal_00048736 [Lupinus albus]|nr:hypothetical protein Lal_00048736 [Lupinus albus]